MTFLKAAALFAEGEAVLPRFRDIGDLTLDLFHHDARVADQWLALHPFEFEMLWRLARNPKKCLSENAIPGLALDQVSFARAADRLLAKLQACGLGDILVRHPQGCYGLQSFAQSSLIV